MSKRDNRFLSCTSGVTLWSHILYLVKWFRNVQSSADCILQNDINNVNGEIWFNIDKWHSISFTRSHFLISQEYHINNVGVLFDRSLNFVKHISSIIQTGYRNLRFITIDAVGNFGSYSYKAFYCAMVSTGVEDTCTQWSPYYRTLLPYPLMKQVS